jgi:DNA-binding CsgD family transcriptional regulator
MTAPTLDTKHPPIGAALLRDPLGAQLLTYGVDVERLATPDDVLDRLHDITWQCCRLSVLGAGLFPLKWGDLGGVVIGKTVFLHKSAPKGWWEEYLPLLGTHLDAGIMMAQMSLDAYTWTEGMRRLDPIGVDRWPYELALKHGMRDGLRCVVGGRWLVAYWSRKVLSDVLTTQVRALLFLGASFAAIRLQKLIGPQVGRIPEKKGLSLTPRELAVLRLFSMGKGIGEVAKHLKLGEETVRSHLKKAETKLGVHDRAHAVAQAIRLQLIP